MTVPARLRLRSGVSGAAIPSRIAIQDLVVICFLATCASAVEGPIKALSAAGVKDGKKTCRRANDGLHHWPPGKAGPTMRTHPGANGRTASPTTLHGVEVVPEMKKLIDAARRTLDVDQKAADAGLHDNPKTMSTSLDATESEVCAHFVALARQRRERCEADLARLQLDRKTTAAKIDVEQTRDSFARLLTAIEPSLEKLKSDHSAVLYQAKENEARALKHFRWFQQKHGLHHRTVRYPESPFYHFAIVAALALVEWVSLSAFYAEGSDFGLLGGVLIAMGLSVVNISLAVLTGSLLRYVNHHSARRRALALTGVTCLYAAFVLVTLAAAHYRVATNDIAQAQSNVSAPTANDQWRAARLAGQRFARNPLGFDDVFSWILIVLAAVFGVFASYKGYRLDDPYPGYGELDRDVKRRQATYDAAKAEYCRLAVQVFDRTLHEQAHLL